VLRDPVYLQCFLPISLNKMSNIGEGSMRRFATCYIVLWDGFDLTGFRAIGGFATSSTLEHLMRCKIVRTGVTLHLIQLRQVHRGLHVDGGATMYHSDSFVMTFEARGRGSLGLHVAMYISSCGSSERAQRGLIP